MSLLLSQTYFHEGLAYVATWLGLAFSLLNPHGGIKFCGFFFKKMKQNNPSISVKETLSNRRQPATTLTY
jgi:hypothetical protein